MRTVTGLAFLALCAYFIYYSRLCIATSIDFTKRSPVLDITRQLPHGEYRTVRTELGLLDSPLQRASPVADTDRTASHHARPSISQLDHDNAHSSHLLDRVETSGLTDLRDESWHQAGFRKMRRRTPSFGLGLDLSTLQRDASQPVVPSPISIHTPSARTPSAPQSHILYFAVDAILEPTMSSEQVLDEYATLAVKQGPLGSSSSSKYVSTVASKSPPSALRTRSSRKVRGGRRPPARHVEH